MPFKVSSITSKGGLFPGFVFGCYPHPYQSMTSVTPMMFTIAHDKNGFSVETILLSPLFFFVLVDVTLSKPGMHRSKASCPLERMLSS